MSIGDERLATTDHVGDRIYIYAAEVRGYYTRWRRYWHFVLMLILLALPWIRVQGEQALLLDFPGRRFHFFGLTLGAHDTPLLFFVLILLAVGLGLITAVWGRWWCGWSCPQTVFIASLFSPVEKWIEGSHLERRKLDAAPMSFSKFLKKTSKWTLFILIAVVISHTLMAYFVGAPELIQMMFGAPGANWTIFLVSMTLTALVLFDLAWFREQFCIIMCPYGRFQSVLMDPSSRTVLYDVDRGEPRRGMASKEAQGDCVDCGRCVAVCPTGIDIRQGVQMECIACLKCVDACDDVMAKIGKPRGLIDWVSELKLKKQVVPKSLLGRRFVYLGVLLIVASVFVFSLAQRSEVHVSWLRSKGMSYQVQHDRESQGEWVVNWLRLVSHNQSRRDILLGVRVHGEDPLAAVMEVRGVSSGVLLSSGESREIALSLRMDSDSFRQWGQREVRLEVYDRQDGQVYARRRINFVGPWN